MNLSLIAVMFKQEAGLQPCEYPDANKLFITSKYFPGVLDDSEVRKSALAALEAAYLVANDRVGRLYDELIFMEPDVAMGTAASPLRMSPRVSQWHPSQGR